MRGVLSIIIPTLQQYITERPNIIHCSAGVGRSGTFCLVDSCLERMAKSGVPITQDQVIFTIIML